MTVCIAARFGWLYDNGPRPAVLIAADRMLTAGDIEYEPPKLKMGALTNNVLVLVAGEIVAHSEALAEVQKKLVVQSETDVGKLSEMYAKQIRAFKNKRAEHLYLSPLGMDRESFLSKHRLLDEGQLAGACSYLYR